MKDNTANIQIKVSLDDKKIPHRIHWEGEGQGEKEAKALLLSLWDNQSTDTYKIDLWTGKMKKDEMIQFFSQTVDSLSDTLLRSTGCAKAAAILKEASKKIYEGGMQEISNQPLTHTSE